MPDHTARKMTKLVFEPKFEARSFAFFQHPTNDRSYPSTILFHDASRKRAMMSSGLLEVSTSDLAK